MKRFISKKAMALGLAVGITLGMGGAAFAYFTTSGSGAGTATAYSNVTSTVTAATSPSADATLWPGDATSTALHFSINNPNPYPVQFSTFSGATISAVSGGVCTTADFTLSETSGNLDSLVHVAASTAAPGTAGTATILNMIAAAPDACQGVTVTVTLNVQGAQVAS